MAEWVLLALVSVPLGFFVGSVGYVAVTFPLMMPHTSRRPLGKTLRAALEELFWIARILPAMPLFYVLGARMGGKRAEGGLPVILLHGYCQNRIDFVAIARTLARTGVGPLYGWNYPFLASISKNAARLDRFVDRVREETGAARVMLVGHSMGGVLAAYYSQIVAPEKVDRLVTIASPHGGIPWKGPIPGDGGKELRQGSELVRALSQKPLPVPALSVYSTHDNLAHPPEGSSLVSRGGRDVVIDGAGHFAILFAPETLRSVSDFLVEATADRGGIRSLPPMSSEAARCVAAGPS